ncbi:MAG: cytidylate kinase family protein [Candidatus Aenigmatarchaeota archaeon]|nr:MAG: cytidylate kinase family protein [Candidatus Aenigmarchaeota archaeon]
MIITICGQAGSGKSSVAELLAKRLGFKRYSMGDLRRKAAYERGMTLAEFNKLGEKEDFTDRFVDELQEKLGKEEDNFVVDGRTSFHFIPHSVKVYLHADVDARARRVLRDERKVEKFNNLEECKKALVVRERSDNKRYRKYYGIDVRDRKNYDYWIDTTDLTVKQTVNKIIRLMEKDF